MKLHFSIGKLIVPVAAVLLMSACKKENNDIQNETLFEGNPVSVSFQGGMSFPEGTQKSYLQGDSVVWEDGDEIVVNNQVFTVHRKNQYGEQKKGTAWFWGTATPIYSAYTNQSGNADTVANWFAVYPKSLAANTTQILRKDNNGKLYKQIHVKFPETQFYQEVDESNGKYFKNMNYMVGYTTTKRDNNTIRMQFVNLCAVMKIGFTKGDKSNVLDGTNNNDRIRRIVLLTSTDTKTAMNGEGYVNSGNNTDLAGVTDNLSSLPTIQVQVDNATNTNRKLVLDCIHNESGLEVNANGIALEANATTYFYVMVPINMLNGLNDLCMEVYDGNGNMMKKSIKGNSIVKRNKLYTINMGKLDCQYAASSFIDADFSIDATHSVKFSSGNLQYQCNTKVWRFAPNQWTRRGTANQNVSSNYNGYIDLFGYGCSGYSTYKPYLTSTNESDYPAGSITKTDNDWGWYNEIRSGNNTQGHAKKSFYTWTINQAEYTVNTREASTVNGVANARFVIATVNDVPGVIVFPDEYTHPSGITKPKKANINVNTNTTGKYTDTKYTSTEWAKLEEAGCVFLPSAGIRGYTSGTDVQDPDKWGTYWTSSEKTEDGISHLGGYLVMTTENNQCNVLVAIGSWYKRGGRSVRLVLGNF